MTIDEAILLLSYHPKLGAQSIKKILAAGFPRKNDGIALMIGEKLYKYLLEAQANYDLDKIHQELSRNSIGYITFKDKLYPSLLAEIPDCPAILFVKGDAKSLGRVGISVVGSRKYTNYGARIARKFSCELASNGLSIVSGLALGIDALAHQAALEAGGATIGVLACGLDSVYPVSNHNLAKAMIEHGSAIVSEYPPGTEPYKSNFPARNRIIAGLTAGTLVVEAAKHSGALITATAALEYNREVYAIPGPIDSEASEGTNFLIQQGAKLVANPDDIRIDFDIPAHKAQQEAKDYLPDNETERLVVEMIKKDSLSADEIVRGSGYNVAEVAYVLTMLEMKGILENVSGNWRRKL